MWHWVFHRHRRYSVSDSRLFCFSRVGGVTFCQQNKWFVMAAGCIEYHNLSWTHKHYLRNELKSFFSCLKMVLALLMKTGEVEEANQCAFANIRLLIDCSQVCETNQGVVVPRYSQLCWLGLHRLHRHTSLPFLLPSSFSLVFYAVPHSHWGLSGNLWVITHGYFTPIPGPPV